MDSRIIVARYNEDIKWLNEFTNHKITIYNKGEKVKNNNFSEIIDLKNVGRESHTWLYHIVKNYYQLNEINIFLQGSIDDLGCMAYQNPDEYLIDINKYGFSTSRFGLLGPLHWDWNVGIEKDQRYKDQWLNNQISKSNIGFRAFAKELFPDIPIFVSTSYGGCFAVKKEKIQTYSIKYYKKLLNIMSKHKNPIEGHYMERLWCYMFTKNKPLIESINDVIKTKLENFLL
tara:strand:- start:32327 stop:33016 length:690 start_codon:yes stop_codon:yes gene_type:complete